MNLSRILRDVSPAPIYHPTPTPPTGPMTSAFSFSYVPLSPNALPHPSLPANPTTSPILFPPASPPVLPTTSFFATDLGPPLSTSLSLGSPLPLPAPPATSASLMVTPLDASFIPSPIMPVVNEGFIDTGGATSFARRHPLKGVQVPRFRIRGSQSDAVKLDQAERKRRVADKADRLQQGVNDIIQLRDNEIKNLAAKFSMKEKAIRILVNGETHYKKHRRPSAFNALVHKARGEMNDDLAFGECHKLKEIQDSVRVGMDNNAFSQAYIDKAMDELEELRNVKMMGARSSNMAAYADARSTTASLTNELVSLGMQTGVTGVALIVKGHIHDDFADSIVEFNGSSRFFLDVLNMQAEDVCSRFQQWVCNQAHKPDNPNSLKVMQNDCVTLIVRGLRMITNIANIGMNYVHYQTAIVQKHHIQLLGWPDIPFVNPHQITTVAAIRALCQTLTVGTCKWITLTKRQQQDHAATLAKDIEVGLVHGKKRKVRSDKGKKRKATAPAADDEEDKEQSEGDQHYEDNSNDDYKNTVPLSPPLPKKKKTLPKATSSKKFKAPAKTAHMPSTVKASAAAAKKAKHVARTLPPANPKSKEFIISSDDSDC